MNKHKREKKRDNGTEPSTFNLYTITKEVQNQSGRSIGSSETEDPQFQNYFGVSIFITLLALHISCGPFTS